MRPHRHPAFALLVAAALVAGCSRSAEIYDEPDSMVAPAAPSQNLDLPSVPDAGWDADGTLACDTRPEGDCRGSNDFTCAFNGYAESVINRCFEETGCTADGWVSLGVDAEGCARDIGMETPDRAFVDCVVETLRQVRCPCENVEYEQFLGTANDGCGDDDGPLQ